MKNLLGFVFTVSALISFGQKKELDRTEALNKLAELYLETQVDSTCQLTTEAVLLNDDRFPEEKVRSMLTLGNCEKNEARLDTAYALFTRAKALAEKTGMQKELGRCHWHRAEICLEINQFDKARVEYQKAIMIFQAAKEHELQFRALADLADLEQKQNNLSKSLEYHMMVLQIVEREQYDSDALKTSANIADIYLRLGKRAKGLEFNAKSLRVRDTANQKRHLISGLVQRANLYEDSFNRDSSLYYLNKALDYCDQFEQRQDFVHFRIGLYHHEQGNHRAAIANFRKGFEASPLSGSEYLIATSENYIAIKNYDSALFFARKGYKQALNSNQKRTIMESSKILADLFKIKGDMTRSNKFLYEYAEYQDSVLLNGQARKLADLQVRLEEIDKKEEIEHLKLSAELGDFKRLLILRGASLVVFMMFVCIGLLVRKHQRKQKVHHNKAAGLKNELEKGREDLHRQSMHLIRVNNNVLEIEEKLKELKPKVQGHSMEVQRLINTIRVNKSQDKDWENFNNYFNGLNSGFADRLREHYPNLTINEIRLCSLLKLNLLNSEIASILNVETRSVTMSKYRLKKKLNLEEEINLSTFLMNLDFQNGKQYA